MQERQVTIGDTSRHRLRRAVPRAGDAEPDRAGRHLPAARGAGRPLHAQGAGRLPVARGGAGDPGRGRSNAATASPRIDAWSRPQELLAARALARRRLRRREACRTTSSTWSSRRASRPRSGCRTVAPLIQLRRLAARGDRTSPRRRAPRAASTAAPTSLPEDVKAVALDVLRHRLILTYEAEAEERHADEIVRTHLRRGRSAVTPR